MNGHPRPAWREILQRLIVDVRQGKLSVMAAGIAFFGILSLAPGFTAAVSWYGLAFDPAAVELHVEAFAGIVPKQALDFISDELTSIVSTNHSRLGIGLVISLAIALGTANSATSALMTALNTAFGEEEKRGVVGYYVCSLLLTAGLLLFGTFSLILLTGMPAILDLLPVGAHRRILPEWLRWPVLAVLASLAIAAIYRYGPSRDTARWRWLSWGTVAATILWIAGSVLFSVYFRIGVYIGRFPSYDEAYSALGAVMVLLTWLWLSAFAVLLGGALDAEIEVQTRRGRH